jgi:2-polyprenyl-3-methyl-5-hydroxy-6-metoxy-1,4-benzoquinol methylase
MSTTLHEYERQASNDQAQNDYWAQTRRNILETWVAEISPKKVLDIGCGSGYLADYLTYNNTFVAGIDIDESSIRLAAERPNVDSAIVGDATKLPYESETFELIILGDVVEHFEDPLVVLNEAERVLSQEGTLIISVPAFRWLWGPHDEHNNHTDRYNATRLSDIVAQAGFSFENHRYTNFFPLPIYFVMQRILQRGVPSETRGGHNKIIELVKKILISIEKSVNFPIGITLVAKCSKA